MVAADHQEPLADPLVLVVDDDADYCQNVERWLHRAGYDVRIALNGFEALALAKTHAFDVVITELKMPGLNGLQLLGMFKELDPQIQVIFLTGEGTMEDAILALRGGRAFDFLQKPLRSLDELTLVTQKALIRRRTGAPRPIIPPYSPQLTPLSKHEIKLVTLLAEGLSNREIAERILVSERTIKNRLSRIYEKLGVSSRTQAIAFCQKHNLI